MGRIWAVAKNTVRQALRMKVAIIFIVLLLVLLPTMGLTATGDGTLKGRLQTFVSYGMSLTSVLLCLLTIIVSVYAVTSDIEQRQIYTVVTKPIRRYQLILGKLLGVILLDVGLLTLFCGIVYGVTRYLPAFGNVSPEERLQVENEFFTARVGLVPPKVDVSDEVSELYENLVKDGTLEDAYPGSTREEIIQTMTTRERLKKQAAAVGQGLVWEFENVKPLDPNDSLFIRFKYDVSVTPPDGQIVSRWQIGDVRQLRSGQDIKTPFAILDRKDPVEEFREIEVPASVIADDGYLGVVFQNDPSNQTVVIFPLEDGMEVLYKAGTFGGNFVRAALMILFRLIFLACLGVLAASFLSFPVAILFCLLAFTMGTISGAVLESFDVLTPTIRLIYTYTLGLIVRLLPRFDLYNPTSFLVPARMLGWSLLARVFVVMVGIKALVLLGLGVLIFSFREIARIIV